MTDIDTILAKYGAPSRMVVRADDKSGWLVPFLKEAHDICAANGVEFFFLESKQMNAIAIQDDVEIVGMYAGMFWMLCRLSATVAGSGVFPAMRGDVELSWTPDLQRSIKTPRELLEEETPFDWEMESIGWKQAPERQMLFYMVLTILFRFVVFHELGHLKNDHGLRQRRGSDAAPMLVDQPSPPLIEPNNGVASQAREIVADGYALLMTFRSFEWMIETGQEFELIQLFDKRLRESKISLASFVLTIINLFFRASDRSDWTLVSLDQLTHPPAPFRMKALLALFVDIHPAGLGGDSVETIVRSVILSSDALMSTMLDIFPTPGWLISVTSPAHDLHFERLHSECPHWYGQMQDQQGAPEAERAS